MDEGAAIIQQTRTSAGFLIGRRQIMGMNVEEAAKRLHCSQRKVAELCKTRQLIARKPGKSWVITERAIELYLMGEQNQPCDSAAKEVTTWQSTNVVAFGGATSPRQAEKELSSRLAQLTKQRREKRTTS